MVMLGVADVDVKPFGPVQLKVAPVNPEAVRFRVLPEQRGLLLLRVGAAGCVVIDTVVVEAYEGQPFDVVVVVHE